jgi:hypothetical protein
MMRRETLLTVRFLRRPELSVIRPLDHNAATFSCLACMRCFEGCSGLGAEHARDRHSRRPREPDQRIQPSWKLRRAGLRSRSAARRRGEIAPRQPMSGVEQRLGPADIRALACACRANVTASRAAMGLARAAFVATSQDGWRLEVRCIIRWAAKGIAWDGQPDRRIADALPVLRSLIIGDVLSVTVEADSFIVDALQPHGLRSRWRLPTLALAA